MAPAESDDVYFTLEEMERIMFDDAEFAKLEASYYASNDANTDGAPNLDLAATPPDQVAEQDGRETTEAGWLDPQQALDMEEVAGDVVKACK